MLFGENNVVKLFIPPYWFLNHCAKCHSVLSMSVSAFIISLNLPAAL